eukprot:6378037-Karenia_brevis.AAC.1
MPPPGSPPPLEFPVNWNPKSCSVWEFAAFEAKEEEEEPKLPVKDEPGDLAHEQGGEEKEDTTTGEPPKKRAYH